MAISAKITLTYAGGNTGPFDLYSNTDTYAAAFATGITRSALLAGYTSDVIPSGTSTIRVTSVNDICANSKDLPLILPSATPTATPTQTVTPTATEYKYFFKLKRCDQDPNDPANVYWTMHSYPSNSMTYGNIFKSGGGFYYTIVDHSLTDQGGIIEGSLNTDGYNSCGDVPGHYVGATFRTAHMTMNYYSGYTSVSQITGTTCGKYIYQVPAGSVTRGAYFEASVTGTTPTPGVAYNALYSGSTDGTAVWGESVIANEGHYWAVALGNSSQFSYIVYINNGQIGGWYDCATGALVYS